MWSITAVLLVVAFVPTRVPSLPVKTVEDLSLKLYGKGNGELQGILRFNTYPGAGLVVFAETPVNLLHEGDNVIALSLPENSIDICVPDTPIIINMRYTIFFAKKHGLFKNNPDFVTTVSLPKKSLNQYRDMLNTIVVLYSTNDSTGGSSFHNTLEPEACGLITDSEKDDEKFKEKFFSVNPLPATVAPSTIEALKYSLVGFLLFIIIFILL